MNTEIYSIKESELDHQSAQKALKRCGEIIRNGGLVCFPTETVYGLGANALDAEAVSHIFAAKGRPADNPLIVHIASLCQLDKVTSAKGQERELLERISSAFWPGPITCVASKSAAIPDTVTCDLDTVGIRLPANLIAQGLIKAAGVPIAAPSANISGRPSPTCIKHVMEDMFGKVDAIIDGGDCKVGVESTVFDISRNPPTILRPGAITLEDLQQIDANAGEYDWHIAQYDGKPLSPGLKYKHYAPRARVSVYAPNPAWLGDDAAIKVANCIKEKIFSQKTSNLTFGVLATDETVCYYKDVAAEYRLIVLSLGSRHDSLEQASRLFKALRDFDKANTDIIYAEAVPDSGIGDAVMNRLYRAAGAELIIC